MDEHGRMTDVIVEESFYTDPRTGVEKFLELTVWADRGYENIIKAVPGVAHAYTMNGVRYSVTVDPRYDRDFVGREIEAAILCNKPEAK